MGQAANAFLTESEFEAFSPPAPDMTETSMLRCIVVHSDDALLMRLDEIGPCSKYRLEVSQVRTLAETRDIIDRNDADLLFLSVEAEGDQGLAFAASLSNDCRTCYFPIIMITAGAVEEVAVDVLRTGASDCLSEAAFTKETIGRAIDNAMRGRRRNQADDLALISNLESENATLRRIALRNMRLLKMETMPLLAFAWNTMKEKSLEGGDSKQLAQRLSRVTRTVMGLIDDTVITSVTHKALETERIVDLGQIAKRIIEDDCGEIRLSSAHFRLKELPCLYAREATVSMLFEELFVSFVRNARLGNVPEIEVGSSTDSKGNPIIVLTDTGVPLSVRKQALSQRFVSLKEFGSANNDVFSWSLCQRLTEKCGGEFRISETSAGQVKISLRFPSDLLRRSGRPEDASRDEAT